MDSKKIELQTFDLKNRDIYIVGEITTSVSNDILKQCKEIIQNDEEVVETNKNMISQFYNKIEIPHTIKYPDVNVYLNTFGGSCYEGWSIYDTFQQLNKHCNVNITVTGSCMSMGINLLLSVPYEQRKCTKTSTFLIHQAAGMAFGKSSEIEDQSKELKRMTEISYDIISSETEITKKELKENYSKKDDWIITADKALDLKLVSEII